MTENFLNVTLAAIMVSVDFDQGCKARISLAAALAARFNSLLIGVAGWPLQKHRRETSSEAGFPGLGSPELVSKELANLGEKFRNIAGAVTDQLEWRSSMNFPRARQLALSKVKRPQRDTARAFGPKPPRPKPPPL